VGPRLAVAQREALRRCRRRRREPREIRTR
jgi:hypothetical protein